MRSPVSYPGVDRDDTSSGVRTITGVATSTTAFIGRTRRGPANQPTRIASFREFEDVFGRRCSQSTVSHAVAQFFENGGAEALVVRIVGTGAAPATARPAGAALSLAAVSPGTWGNSLAARIAPVADDATNTLFDLTVVDAATGTTEQFDRLSTDAASPRFVTTVIERSSFVRVLGIVPSPLVPGILADADGGPTRFAGGSDGEAIIDDLISKPELEASQQGLWALDKVDLFNLLCIPPFESDRDVGVQTRNAAAAYCEKRRAFLIVDPLMAWSRAAQAREADDPARFMARSSYAAVFFPFLRAPDPELPGSGLASRIRDFAPCGAIAGIFARIDAARGVWKAPAGDEATVAGVSGLSVALDERENGELNALAVNCLRSFPSIGTVVWGARTLDGDDRQASDWKFIPVRRLALFIEESLDRGTKWVAFEPNAEPTWAQIRRSVGAFMANLFRQGAFLAHFVKCDQETTTQSDVDLGLLNIVVGFAPLAPAEFVVIRIQQIVRQSG